MNITEDDKTLQFIPLGGMGEIGKNMYVYRYGDEIVVVDCGQMFPDGEMFGIDSVLPDFTYLRDNVSKIKGILLTHGHEDHIGALPYVLREIKVPVFGTGLTLGLVRAKLKENPLNYQPDLRIVVPGQTVDLGKFKAEIVRVNHSIPDAVAIALHTPLGIVVHTGDFKIDQTPVDGNVFDLQRFAALGGQGVVLLVSDSTNAERPGFTRSERVVGDSIDEVFREAEGRILLATFASNVHRIQQAIDAAERYGRKVAIVGRSMVNVAGITAELGYMKVPQGILVELDEVKHLPKEKVAILMTGSQGEPLAALSQIAIGNHKKLEINSGDTVVLAATPIPGNERLVGKTINNLFKRGANVVYNAKDDIHVSGHASREELKTMISLTRPKYFIPCHGEYRHLVKHADLAIELGIPLDNVSIAENGNVMQVTQDEMLYIGDVQAGKVFVDGLGVGDVGSIVLRDRKHLSQDGILVIVLTINKKSGAIAAGPDVISRGFVYVRESEDLIDDARDVVISALEKSDQMKSNPEWSVIKSIIRNSLANFLYERTGRRPMILPVIMEI